MRSHRDEAAVVAAVAGGGVAALGTVSTWYTIAIGGVTAPGGSATGLEGRDGRTVLAAGVIALAAGALVALRRRLTAAKLGLIAAGAITSIVAVAGIVDATGKDDAVAEEFGIPAQRVSAEVGTGLWMVAVAGAALLAAGVMVELEAEPAAPPGAGERAEVPGGPPPVPCSGADGADER